ncbi:MAG TPA: hypothetical protein VG015_04795, partial [Candidatus Dormibacteraeota bacterium]|nr:hypothetical protein [Candidatus Dormibacteraeota bacterium]
MIFAILALLLGANVIRATLLVPTFGLDFHVYYLAAHAGWAQGWSHITDPSYVWQAGRRLHPVTLPLRNPPFIIWLMAPLALLPEPLGLRIWVSVSVLITLTAFAWVGGPLKREPLYWMTIAGLYPIVYMLFLG